jgi:hypothetical protein
MAGQLGLDIGVIGVSLQGVGLFLQAGDFFL